ncbi:MULTISPECIES: hypothetical protein [Clostridium]|jgi:inhibitor of KinA sporulation pathway (predicted exonuclease)|uniref:Inhibitor of KinA sporulation pathway (Predicted exonuclease) n=2 Tax=Clostridium TaxID=1485 RepID=A0AAE5LSL3_CLOBE|nr:hypothetical protein [Clostridium beijerinckii]NSB17015.1 inhibitor of KinA sporulation pathway (predicted exonuclease) [Clostridium beijerinckii]OOM26794.1 hypothetical protein CLOBE_31470 [Clostridium beijerinckii]
MDELKKRKIELESKLSEIEAKDISQIVTEADVKSLLSNFSSYVISKNVPECKKFIRDFVKEVIVYKDTLKLSSMCLFVFRIPPVRPVVPESF